MSLGYRFPQRRLLPKEEPEAIEALRTGNAGFQNVESYFNDYISGMYGPKDYGFSAKVRDLMVAYFTKLLPTFGERVVYYSGPNRIEAIPTGSLPDVMHKDLEGYASTHGGGMFYYIRRNVKVYPYFCIRCGQRPAWEPAFWGDPEFYDKPCVRVKLTVTSAQGMAALSGRIASTIGVPSDHAWANTLKFVPACCLNCEWRCGQCATTLPDNPSDALMASMIAEGACVECTANKLTSVTPPKPGRTDLRRLTRFKLA